MAFGCARVIAYALIRRLRHLTKAFLPFHQSSVPPSGNQSRSSICGTPLCEVSRWGRYFLCGAQAAPSVAHWEHTHSAKRSAMVGTFWMGSNAQLLAAWCAWSRTEEWRAGQPHAPPVHANPANRASASSSLPESI
jgi:hypothetical protein